MYNGRKKSSISNRWFKRNRKRSCKVFAENGYDVVINYVSDKTDVEGIKKEFEEKGVKCLLVKADVSKAEDVKIW